MRKVQEVRTPRAPSVMWPIPLVRHKGGRPIRCVIVSDDWYGFETHYHDERTIACPGPEECLLCEKGVDKRWCGTLIVGLSRAKGFSLFPFTQACVNSLQCMLVDHESLVGLVVEFSRTTISGRSMMRCAFREKRTWRGKVYTKEHVRAHTERIFGVRDVYIPRKSEGEQLS